MLSAISITSFVTALICTLSCIADANAGIDCFKCVSLEWQNRACDDPFHNNFSSGLLESPCMGGRKGRNGLFPATACIKLTGYYKATGQHVTVRGCALDSGTLTTDTEIIRMSHCGGFYFDDKYVDGCLQSCDDADGCNPAPPPKSLDTTLLMMLVVMPLVVRFMPHEWAPDA
ncbi:uncharacterized protein LOC100571778 isoform X1 [Acyrthosiphon pisum]|uniref:Protein sleepless n=1 Tax=Acyrthosiphon pisum TaxID=7029 RepID=A0A8R2H9Y2_ACYPI|nr:uncharacterized protein LOC100571778 isoform X1 [Acyrthosiphon pisum]XP_016660966.1 uncharacterized protein LOC100571778 isoform X1 [Acyrthosiphon pisum]|eukprot:XP_008184358.1 PREDICTED: uncharacterized protein LOC100571778 [Acyrthosiphon pisum]